jgi:hypothetical protein
VGEKISTKNTDSNIKMDSPFFSKVASHGAETTKISCKIAMVTDEDSSTIESTNGENGKHKSESVYINMPESVSTCDKCQRFKCFHNFSGITYKKMIKYMVMIFLFIKFACSNMDKSAEITISTPFNQAFTYRLFDEKHVIESTILRKPLVIIVYFATIVFNRMFRDVGFLVSITFNVNRLFENEHSS